MANVLDMRGLVMFAGRTCGPCRAAAQWLEQHRVPFRKIEVDGNMALIQMLQQRTGQMTVPQFFLDDQWLSGGFRQVQQIVSARY